MNWLRRVFSGKKMSRPDNPAAPASSSSSASDEAQAYIDRVHKKIDGLVSDFARGTINRTQFQELYSHYQREIRQIESLITTHPEAWQEMATEGQSVVIHRQHMARAQAYAIYDNETGLPLGTLGEFKLAPALVVPMLSSYRSATKEIFGGGMRLTQIEGGQWLCFVPGKFTTLLAVFINEPLPKQLEYLDKLHQHFEEANRPIFVNKPVDVEKLIYPHEYFLGKWRK